MLLIRLIRPNPEALTDKEKHEECQSSNSVQESLPLAGSLPAMDAYVGAACTHFIRSEPPPLIMIYGRPAPRSCATLSPRVQEALAFHVWDKDSTGSTKAQLLLNVSAANLSAPSIWSAEHEPRKPSEKRVIQRARPAIMAECT